MRAPAPTVRSLSHLPLAVALSPRRRTFVVNLSIYGGAAHRDFGVRPCGSASRPRSSSWLCPTPSTHATASPRCDGAAAHGSAPRRAIAESSSAIPGVDASAPGLCLERRRSPSVRMREWRAPASYRSRWPLPSEALAERCDALVGQMLARPGPTAREHRVLVRRMVQVDVGQRRLAEINAID
jgi:hypothetical protein